MSNNDERATDFEINNYIHAKKFDCPVCEAEFFSNVVRESRVRVRSIDFDLHPICQHIDPNFYDVVICPKCGYAAMRDYFQNIISRQADLIKQEITPKFKVQDYPTQLSVDMAIKRYEQALMTSMAKNAKDGEKAYICMKIMWLHKTKNDTDKQKQFAKLSLKGFTTALTNEDLPIMGLNGDTITYLLGALCIVLEENESALRHLSEVVVSKTASGRLKEKARDLKDQIRE